MSVLSKIKTPDNTIYDIADKISGYEESSHKVTTWNSSPTDINYPSEKLVKEEIDDLRDTINGKETAYVISIVDNPEFNSTNDPIEVDTDLVDVDGHTIALAGLKKGDVVLIREAGIPDRWVTGNEAETLPTGYTKLKYVSSTGNQYVDTGLVITTTDFSLMLDVEWTGNGINDFETYAGMMAPSNLPRYGINKYTGKYMYGINTTVTTNTVPDSNRHRL